MAIGDQAEECAAAEHARKAVSNLLVIDWDFFFRNPMEAGDLRDGELWLYDWGHRESPFYVDGDTIWPVRAAGFQRVGMELPRVDVPARFWDRFIFEPETRLYVADSNAYAGLLRDQNDEPFEHVYLFDAHHDLYKFTSRTEVISWHETRADITCENWMFKHLMRGSELHWRMPRWHGKAAEMAEQLPDWVGLEAAYDDGKPMGVSFDTAFLCRSGAWVPPWCDTEFEKFMNSAPVIEVDQMDDWMLNRGDGWRQQAELWVRAEKLAVVDSAGVTAV